MSDNHQQPLRVSIANRGIPASPITSGESSSGVTRLSRYGSMSTLATSNAVESTEWYEEDKIRNSSSADGGTDYEVEVRLPASQRPKGRYSLNDFSLMRTVGTGSFGRVHLGELTSVHNTR